MSQPKSPPHDQALPPKTPAVLRGSPLAIIGIGCLFPKASGLQEYWANIKNKVDGLSEVPPTHWSAADYFDSDPKKPDLTYARRGGFLSPVDFDPAEFGVAPSALEATDSAQLLGLVAAQRALQDAGYGPERDFDRSRVSVILGVTGTLELVIPLGARLGHPIWRKALKEAGIEGAAAEEIVERIKDGYVPWQEMSFPGLLGNVVAGRIAKRFNLGGTNCVVDAACASSLSAMHLAGLELGAGRSDMAVTGGADCFNDIFMFMCFSKTPALSATGESRPFDRKADGTMLGEGLGFVVLKRLADAEKDGDRIYAVLRGIGSSSDGRGKAVYAPCPVGQSNALREAYQVAEVSPETVELVEAHGTGTVAGDSAELEGLTAVFREAKSEGTWCALGSVKSMIGHTKAAAGSAGLIKAALALHHKVLPPTIRVDEPLEPLASGSTPFYLNTEKRPWLKREHPRRAAVSALGFGGSNFHAVLEEYRPEKPGPDWDGEVQIAAFSAQDREGLLQGLEPWRAELSWDEVRVLAMSSRAEFRPGQAHRLCLVIEKGRTDTKTLAVAAAKALAAPEGRAASLPVPGLPEAFYASGAPGKLAVLFPGQGSQYVGMLRDLACQFPQAFAALAEADAAFAGPGRLSDLIYPAPAFTAQAKAAQEEALRATSAAQPALGAAGLGAFRVLESFGLKADAAAGHSYGELPALCAGGAFDAPALFALSALRGRLMAEAGRSAGDPGGMLAVSCALPDLEAAVKEETLDLVIANRNSPRQFVLSGKRREIARAAEALEKRGLRSVALPVAAAFHSPLVAGAEGAFRLGLEGVAWRELFLPVYANKTGGKYPRVAAQAKALLGSQLASPVEFSRSIEALYDEGVRLFVECGPGARLSGLVEAILSRRPGARALAVDASLGRKSGTADLARVLAELAAAGLALRLGLWQGGEDGVRELTQRKKPKLSVKLTGANYRSTAPKFKGPSERKGAVAETATALSPQRKGAAVTSPAALPPALSGLPAPGVSGAGVPPPTEIARGLQAGIEALQKMQERAAELHAQFLQGQEAAQRALQALIERQGLAAGDFNAPAPAQAPALLGAATDRTAKDSAARAGVAEETRSALIAVVSEKTGYPAETLEPDMDMESDLGIDSIKRVEILSALQERLPGAPKVKPEHLGTLRTLRQIEEFLAAGTVTATALPPQQPAAVPPGDGGFAAPFGAAREGVARAGVAEETRSVLIAVVSEKTGYPVETLEPDMDMESDLGIDSIKRVEILSALQERLPGAPKVKPEHLGTLRTLRQIEEFLAAGTATATALLPQRSSGAARESATISSTAAAPDGAVQRLVLKAQEFDAAAKRDAVAIDASAPVLITEDGTPLARALAGELAARGLSARVISLDAPPAREEKLGGLVILAPVRRLAAGALWGSSSEEFLKKALLLAKAAGAGLRRAGEAGGAVFATVSRLDGAFGLSGLKSEQDPMTGGLAGLAKTAAREWPEVSCRALDAAQGFAEGSLARALAEELFLAGPLELGLSAAGKKTLRLAESSAPESGPEPLRPGDLVLVTGGARGVTAEAAVALAKAFRPTLALLGRSPRPGPEPEWLAACRGEAEIQKAILRQGGVKRSPKELGEECRKILAAREIRQVLLRLEAAGARAVYVQLDLRREEETAAALKALQEEHGPARGLAHGAGVLADKFIVDKTREQLDGVFDTKLAGLRHALKALDLGELKLLALFSSTTARLGRAGQSDYAMANEALNKAAQLLSRRLPDCRVVSVNWGPWAGGMVNEGLRRLFEKEGVALIGLEAGARFLVAEARAASPAVEVTALGEGARREERPSAEADGLSAAFERELSLEDWPFLRSHVINGRAVLPLAVTAEMLAHAALHLHPGLAFHGFEGLRVFKGVLLGEGSVYPVSARAGKLRRREGQFLVEAELRGPGGQRHAAATILLVARLPGPEPARMVLPAGGARGPAEALYREVLFHGPEMRFLRAVEGISDEGIVAEAATALAPSSWMRRPWREEWLADPAALDAAFQAVIVWTRERLGAGSLPSQARGYRQYRARWPAEGVRLLVRVHKRQEGLVETDIEFLDHEGGLVARLEGYEATVDPSLNEAFRRNAVGAI